jgi:D-alanyl-D-alanine carboxypeptidase
MTGVNALSGYVFPKGMKEPLVFSIINNGAVASETDVRNGIDSIGVLLAELTPC